jgi:hypothetical protein
MPAQARIREMPRAIGVRVTARRAIGQTAGTLRQSRECLPGSAAPPISAAAVEDGQLFCDQLRNRCSMYRPSSRRRLWY